MYQYYYYNILLLIIHPPHRPRSSNPDRSKLTSLKEHFPGREITSEVTNSQGMAVGMGRNERRAAGGPAFDGRRPPVRTMLGSSPLARGRPASERSRKDVARAGAATATIMPAVVRPTRWR